MIYLFLGKDINIIKRKIDTLVIKLNIDNIIKYDMSSSSFDEVLDEVSYVDLFNQKKLVIVSYFSFKKITEKEEKRLINFINSNSENNIIIKCIDDSLDERKKITKLIKEKCNIDISEKLDYKVLHQYVTNIFKENDKNIAYNQVKRILDLCEYNTDITLNEVDKLLIYTIGIKDIKDEYIEDVISKSNEKAIFDIVEFVLKKDISSCLNTYKVLVHSNVDATIIVDAIAKEFRNLYQIKNIYGKISDRDLSQKIGIMDFKIKKLLPFTREYSDEELLNKLYELSEIDEKIKNYNYDKNKVMEMFFISL